MHPRDVGSHLHDGPTPCGTGLAVYQVEFPDTPRGPLFMCVHAAAIAATTEALLALAAEPGSFSMRVRRAMRPSTVTH